MTSLTCRLLVCCNVEDLNLGMKTCAHRTLRLFSSGHLADLPIAMASGFIAGTAHVSVTDSACSCKFAVQKYSMLGVGLFVHSAVVFHVTAQQTKNIQFSAFKLLVGCLEEHQACENE